MFAEGKWAESDKSNGTKENPCFIEIPPIVFGYVLRWCRNDNMPIPQQFSSIKQLLCLEKEEEESVPEITKLSKTSVQHKSTDRSYQSGGNGSLVQLVAQGDEDKYLSGDSQITFFKEVYR